jgi:hypothetical protein
MKKNPRSILFLGLLAFLALGLASSIRHFHPFARASAARTLLYHCPMECLNDKTYELPGACPVCHMELVPFQPKPPVHRVGGFARFAAQKQTVDRIVWISGALSAGSRLNARLNPADAPLVKAGQTCVVYPRFITAPPVWGKVISLSGTAAAIQLQGTFKPGTFVLVEIHAAWPADLAVPVEAVWQSGGDDFVFRKDGDAFPPRKVKVKVWGDRFVQIAEGLQAGDVVATGALFWLAAEAKLDPAAPPAEGGAP